MTTLFSAWQAGTIQAANRLVRSATGEGAATVDVGCPTPAMANFYGTLAGGGVGLIISGHTAVSFEGRCSNTMTAFYDDAFIPAFTRMVDAVHKHNVPIVCQLNHGGRQVNPDHKGIVPLAPSAVLVEGASHCPQELSPAEIERIIVDFGAAARRAREAGFDAVQIHSAHGYLISQFNSPLTNRRSDQWGGSASKRRSFLKAVYATIREQVGQDYPILVKQNVSDFHPQGLTEDEAVEICRMLDGLGIAAIELSGGIAETVPVAFRASDLRQHHEAVFFEDQARRIGQVVSCPLILTGGIRTSATSERMLAEKVCTAVGFCRPFIREPDLPQKWQANSTASAACISCGACRADAEHCNWCPLQV